MFFLYRTHMKSFKNNEPDKNTSAQVHNSEYISGYSASINSEDEDEPVKRDLCVIVTQMDADYNKQFRQRSTVARNGIVSMSWQDEFNQLKETLILEEDKQSYISK